MGTAVTQTPAATHLPPRSAHLRALLRPPAGAGSWGDRLFTALTLSCALLLPAILTLTAATLATGSVLALRQLGLHLLTDRVWNPVAGTFGTLPFVFGTLVTSAIALLFAAPAGIGTALFITEICPARLRTVLSFLTDLLAAVPSVVYGLWALLVLAPVVRTVIGPALARLFGWTGLLAGPNYGVGVLTASMVLTLMLFPAIASVAREVVRAVPAAQREGALALGATQWEMLRLGILRNARAGLAGALMLALGRALGETMAVAMVIGAHPGIFRSLLAPGYTLSSVIVNEFAEASTDLHFSALAAVGLLLLLVTTVVNGLARLLVWFVRQRLAVEAI